MRSPSAFSEVSVKPSFLRTTPAKKPRTECCCQPVAFIIAAIVAPLGCLSRVRTTSCLVLPRPEDEGAFPGLAGCFARPLVWALLCDILRSLSVATASAPSPPKPRTGDTAGGAGSREVHVPQRCRNSDALLAPESQSFLDNVIAD